jgi:hypothetical protein
MTTKTKNQLATVKPTQRRKRITLADVKQIASLTECQRLNYQEATALLGINYETWRSWKERAKNEPRLAHIIARVKAAYFKGRLMNIQDAETGKHGHRPDWRASKALLEIAAPDRYGTQPPPFALPPPAVNIRQINLYLDKAYAALDAGQVAGQVVVAPEVALLPENTDPAPAPRKRRMPPPGSA